MATIEKYASTVEQISDDRFQSNSWSNLSGAVGDNGLSAKSTYLTKGGSNYVPQQLYCHDFDVTLPSRYDLKSISLEVRIRGKNVNAKVPIGYFYFDNIIGHGAMDYSKNIYRTQPNYKIPDATGSFYYTMDASQMAQFGLTGSKLQGDNFGVILQFNESSINTEGYVYVEYVKLTVVYEEPKYTFEIRGNTTPDKYRAVEYPFQVYTHTNVKFYCHNINYLTSAPKTLQIDLDYGLKVTSFSTSVGASYNPNTREVTFDWDANRSPYVELTLEARTTGVKGLSISGDGIGKSTEYLRVVNNTGAIESLDDILITSTDVRYWWESCFHFAVRTYTSEGTVGYNVWLTENDSIGNELIGWRLNEEKSSAGISINTNRCTNNYVEFTIPTNKEVEIYFDGCFLPKEDGEQVLTIIAESGDEFTYEYTCLEPYEPVVTLSNHDIIWYGGRLTSTTTTGAYVYPVGTYEYDKHLVEGKCTLSMKKYNDIDFIGCVPLQQTHFDPKSTYKDTLLNTSYKNKRYMGKKGAVDETITLNVRLPPKDTVTMQGLIDMDKPVPIDANHRCFEGDPLNHRGWIELYGMTTTETNPHWYKCDISVKYITHNLNTRFLINRGSKVSDYFLPSYLKEKTVYGSNLNDVFDVGTTGGYSYDSGQLDYHKRNFIGLPNGRYLHLRSIEPLGVKSKVSFNWYSTRNAENTNNNISHIIKLIDGESGNAVMEYEYYDIDFTNSDYYACRVICRVLHKGAYKTILNRDLILSKDVEYNNQIADDVDLYGSELILELENDKLNIQDCGFTGRELFVSDIDLQNGQYYFDVEFKNNNIDADAPSIINYLDVALEELDLSSQYSNYYQNLMVSPFPIPDKGIVFTRECEDGTIFYLEDDGGEFSYMISPFYQYQCGVDLQNREGSSIFNLDNSYKTVYITNGLVKLGINRYTGQCTLSKFDRYSREYLLVSNFQLTKYDDININSFTDDKIELQASDCVFTMWRGRPYVHIAHKTEDILFNDDFTKIYADGVGDNTSINGRTWNLIDTTNLLPSELGSDRGIKKTSWTETVVSDYTPSHSQNTEVVVDEEGDVGTPYVFGAMTDVRYDDMRFIIDGEVLEGEEDSGSYYTHTLSYSFAEAGYHFARVVYFRDNFFDVSEPLYLEVDGTGYKITPTFPSQMYYMEHDFTCVLTHNDEPVSGERVVFYVNGLSYPRTTDSDGIATLNNRLAPKQQSVLEFDEETGYEYAYCTTNEMPDAPTGTISSSSGNYGDWLTEPKEPNATYPQIYRSYRAVGETDWEDPVLICGETQGINYCTSTVPYTVRMTYAEGGDILATAEKDTLIEKGFVNIDINKTTVTQGAGEYLVFTFTNNLDPEDDDVEEIETLITNQAVTLSVNGRDYPRVTDSNGQCKLQINLPKGIYNLRVAFAGSMFYNDTTKSYEIKVQESNQ